MERRAIQHDYYAPAIYMVTLTTVGREPLLGTLVVDEDNPHIAWSEVGKMVAQEIEKMPVYTPAVKILQKVIMPDHVHLILQVTKRLPRHFSMVIRGFKQGCTKGYDALLKVARTNSQDGAMNVAAQLATCASALTTTNKKPLFAPGMNDKIIWHPSQLPVKIAYIKDNPRRLMLKRQSREYFRIERGHQAVGETFDLQGNIALLRCPLRAVHVRAKWTLEEVTKYSKQWLEEARRGRVLIGAFISEAERQIQNRAIEEGLPLIRIEENGLPELAKPSGQWFDYCADGRLLRICPWPYHTEERVATREQCRAMNRMAEALAGEVLSD